MRIVGNTEVYAQNISLGLRHRIGATGKYTEDLEAAMLGKLVARGGPAPEGWTYTMSASPGFLSRPQKIAKRSFEVTSTCDEIGRPDLVEFIPEGL